MTKQPCHITDETGSHISDPADVPDAVDMKYQVFIPIEAWIVTEVTAENESDAIQSAKKSYSKEDIEDIIFKTDVYAEEL